MWRMYICIAVCAGCAEGKPDHITVSDSAGIRIVSLEDLESVPTAHVSSKPLVRIGEVDGPLEYIFSRVAGGEIVGDMVIVADGSSSEIRQFDSRGRFVRQTGAKGEGPGEFAMLRWMKTVGDTSVIAWDLGNRRFSHFSVDLEYERSAVFNPPATYVPLEILADGSLLVGPFGGSAAPLKPGSTIKGTAVAALGRPNQETLDTVAEVPARPSYVDGSGELWRLPFTVDPSFTVSTSGHIWVGNGNDSELRRYSRTGEVELIVRLPIGGSIAEADMNSWLASDPEHAAELRIVPVPDRYPGFSELASSSDGTIWVKLYASFQGATALWLVLDSSGLPTLRAVVPNGEILDIEANQVLLLDRDSLGVERVASYRFPRTRH